MSETHAPNLEAQLIPEASEEAVQRRMMALSERLPEHAERLAGLHATMLRVSQECGDHAHQEITKAQTDAQSHARNSRASGMSTLNARLDTEEQSALHFSATAPLARIIAERLNIPESFTSTTWQTPDATNVAPWLQEMFKSTFSRPHITRTPNPDYAFVINETKKVEASKIANATDRAAQRYEDAALFDARIDHERGSAIAEATDAVWNAVDAKLATLEKLADKPVAGRLGRLVMQKNVIQDDKFYSPAHKSDAIDSILDQIDAKVEYYDTSASGKLSADDYACKFGIGKQKIEAYENQLVAEILHDMHIDLGKDITPAVERRVQEYLTRKQAHERASRERQNSQRDSNPPQTAKIRGFEDAVVQSVESDIARLASRGVAGKDAYRTLAKRYHADHGGNEELMKYLSQRFAPKPKNKNSRS